MSSGCRLSLVTAVQYAQANLPEILHSLDPDSHPDVEFLFCATEADPDVRQLVQGHRNCRVLYGQEGSLIPHLWRDGIYAAQAERVALGTAHCIPATDLVKRLLEADMREYPGMGGMIVNDPESGPRDWAIYLLRYISFAPPQDKHEVDEIAADNAVYRRADIVQHADLLNYGFWEPSFHARFREAGMRLMLNTDLCVVHRNRYTSRQFFVQRLLHGREFGLARASSVSMPKRLALILLSPVLPVVFLAKIIRSVFRQGSYTAKLLLAAPWLILFLLAWGLGEAGGYISAGQRPYGRQGEQREGDDE